MRVLLGLLLGLAVAPAIAKDADSLRDKLASCLPLPAKAVGRLKVTFEVTLDDSGKARSVVAVSYQPASKEMEQAVAMLASSIQRCWPAGFKSSPAKISIDLTDF